MRLVQNNVHFSYNILGNNKFKLVTGRGKTWVPMSVSALKIRYCLQAKNFHICLYFEVTFNKIKKRIIHYQNHSKLLSKKIIQARFAFYFHLIAIVT